jgi:hypothetical protein
MFSVLTREHSSKLVNRLTAAASSRFQAAVNPTLINTASFSDTAHVPKQKPKHIKKPKHISPGTLGLPRVKIYGSTLRLKVVDPARVEAKKMRREIDAIFKVKANAQENVDLFIAEVLETASIVRLADFMRVSCQKNRKEFPLLKKHLPVLAKRISDLTSEPWTFKQIAFVVYSLQHIQEKDRHIMNILSSMVKVSAVTMAGDVPPSSMDIAMIILGLQHHDATQVQAGNILGFVEQMLQVCTAKFDAQSLSNSFYGLRGMDITSPQALAVLASITKRVDKCKGTFTAQQIGFALNGFQNMNDTRPEVLEGLKALMPLVGKIPKTFRSQQIGHAIIGLQKMTSETPEVLQMMDCLIPEFAFCREKLTAEDTKKVLLGTKKMGNKCPQVRTMKAALGLQKYLDFEERGIRDDSL